MLIRKQTEENEKKLLSPIAALSCESKGRARPERECDIRTCFQRDRDRVIHSKAFRRLKHKTQVFISPTNDHYRTRLTHVIEVSQIARTISRALMLNEDLTEAIALGHDLGHTPFGHSGEAALNEMFPGGFKHVRQSMRIIDVLERDGEGLNLTHEVRDGIAKHSKGWGKEGIDTEENRPLTLEGQITKISDLVAYANHDLDDATRSGIISPGDVPEKYISVLGKTASRRINTMVVDIVEQTIEGSLKRVLMSEEVLEALMGLRAYLYENVYTSERLLSLHNKSKKVVKELYLYFCENEKIFRENFCRMPEREGETLERAVCDFIAGMSDLYALSLYQKIFLPSRWTKGEEARGIEL
ncbi:MAG: deoxyguanosinetriphosphate triphosphohydrolase [Candidatus Dadabacteria bacterium]|nr:deoxyguanosinetriphosphate triphosphohydrolase [Candidatus Dadabacteria bacterium]MYI73065.1 deoxyguanosinetriphosphate triphosphohydrolase [Candidatus Dadabacteria bacterium]